MFKRLLIPAVLAALVGAVAYAGSYDRGSYDVSGGSYQAGTVDAGWDTLVFFMAYAPDSNTVIDPNFAESMREADATSPAGGGVIDLQGTVFAYARVDSANPVSTIDQIDGTNGQWKSGIKSTNESSDYFNLTLGAAARQINLIYYPFEDLMPANVQIVSAEINTQLASNSAFITAASDSVVATLMTIPEDNMWYSKKGITVPATMTNAAYSSYRHQVFGGSPTPLNQGYPAAPEAAWIPQLQDRLRFWDWGNTSDLTGFYGGTTLVQLDKFAIDITNCVQAAVNGDVNNGIAISLLSRTGSAATLENTMWEPTAVNPPYISWIKIKAITRSYRAPWPGGAEAVFTFCTDDGRRKINQAAADTFGAYGGRFSMYITGAAMPGGDGAVSDSNTYVTTGMVAGWHDKDVVEVGSHTFFSHPNEFRPADYTGNRVGGLGVYNVNYDLNTVVEYTRGMYPDTLTAAASLMDSLLYDSDPEFMFYQIENAGFGNYRGRHFYGQSFGNAVSPIDPAGQMALAYHGYIGIRHDYVQKLLLDSNSNNDPKQFMSWRPAKGDTTYGAFRPNHMLEPRNVRFLSMTNDIGDFVGLKTDNPSMATVEYNARMAGEKARANKRRWVSTISHDVKTDDDGLYDTGVDPDELGAMMRGFIAAGLSIISYQEASEWLIRNSTIMATPPAYAQPDTYSFTIEDAIWGQIDGMDGTFIPQLK